MRAPRAKAEPGARAALYEKSGARSQWWDVHHQEYTVYTNWKLR